MYDAVNVDVLGLVPQSARRILDIGCGTGALARRIKDRIPCEIVGLTSSPSEVSIAASRLDHALLWDLNFTLPECLGVFDCIVASHVLEHLQDPAALLRSLLGCIKPKGLLIVALPNIVHWKQRCRLLMGRFEYTEGGIMDRTHLRFFNWSTAHALVRANGWVVVSGRAYGNFPLPIIRNLVPKIGPAIDRAALSLRPNLFGAQFILVAQRDTEQSVSTPTTVSGKQRSAD